MQAGVIRFPGSNCDRDCLHVVSDVMGAEAKFLWHKDSTDLSGLDLVVLPGGFSYGDYLRCGSIARFSPIMEQVINFAEKGKLVVGICNGFQILTEAGILPGTLMRNKSLKFICKYTHLKVINSNTAFTSEYKQDQVINIPIAHGDGNYIIEDSDWKALEANNQVVFRYCSESGEVSPEYNPNGSCDNIAGIINKRGNVLGMMPHPERCAESLMYGQDGYNLFASIKRMFGGK